MVITWLGDRQETPFVHSNHVRLNGILLMVISGTKFLDIGAVIDMWVCGMFFFYSVEVERPSHVCDVSISFCQDSRVDLAAD